MTAFARVDARELMDDPVESAAELEGNLRDIELANFLFGGIAPVVREVERTAAVSVLDVGCGSADIPLALVRHARRRGAALRVTCLDRNEQMLAIARRRTGADPGLIFVRGEGTSLRFPADAFDVVTCSLALHHFAPDEAVTLLREMRRVARVTPIVCDLLRSRAAHAAAWAFTRAFTRNRLTRHDAPLSVRRAYTPEEALALAVRAEWRTPGVRRERWFRMTLVDDR